MSYLCVQPRPLGRLVNAIEPDGELIEVVADGCLETRELPLPIPKAREVGQLAFAAVPEGKSDKGRLPAPVLSALSSSLSPSSSSRKCQGCPPSRVQPEVDERTGGQPNSWLGSSLSQATVMLSWATGRHHCGWECPDVPLCPALGATSIKASSVCVVSLLCKVFCLGNFETLTTPGVYDCVL